MKVLKKKELYHLQEDRSSDYHVSSKMLSKKIILTCPEFRFMKDSHSHPRSNKLQQITQNNFLTLQNNVNYEGIPYIQSI